MCFVRGNIGFTSRRIAHQEVIEVGDVEAEEGDVEAEEGDMEADMEVEEGGMKAEEEGVEEGGVETKKAMMEAANLGQKLKLHHQ